MTTHPEDAMTRERVLVSFDEVMLAFYNLHSAYGNRFFDKDGPRFQEAYDAAATLLSRWQRGELTLGGVPESAEINNQRQYIKELESDPLGVDQMALGAAVARLQEMRRKTARAKPSGEGGVR